MTKKAHANKITAGLATAGFTLIELSIVLVVIGLIVGGIFVGTDMIKAAELRGTMQQVEKYNSAVNTFRTKFNAIPGDILQAYASAFGLFTLTAGSSGEGDGNGLIEGGASASTAPSGETLVFWRHLSDANLVDGALGTNGNGAITALTGLLTTTSNSISTSLPPSKIRPQQYFIVYADSGFNYFQLYPVTQISNAGVYTSGQIGITPVQAYNIDVKIDDGTPNGGSVLARQTSPVNMPASWASSSTASKCLSNGANATDIAATYNRIPATGGSDTSCSLRFRFN